MTINPRQDGNHLRSRGLFVLLLGTTLIGCQQLGLRPTGFYSDEDEWGAPPSNVSQVPRPYIETKRNKQNVSESAVKTSLSDQANINRTTPEQAQTGSASPTSKTLSNTTTNSPAAELADANQALKRTDPQIVATGADDVDLDAALNVLPPTYQEILKRQLAASKKHATSPNQTPPASNSEEKSGAESTSTKVTFRLSDSENNTQTDNETPNRDSSVVAAAATSSVAGSATVPATVPAAGSLPNQNLPQAVVNAVGNNVSLPTSTQLPISSQLPTSRNDRGDATHSTNTEHNSTASPSPNDAVNNPSNTATTNWHQSISQAITSLEKQMESSPAADENLRLHQELTLRMLYASLRKPEEAMQPISGLSDEENEYYRNQMMALIEASNPDAMPVRSRHLSLVMDSQRKATGFLAAASNLEVRNIAFCTDVERYGVITKFPKYQFKPDEEVLLYCEVENVSALPVKDGFESQLQGSYEILDNNGNRIVEQTLPMEPDVCQNVRRDYYMVYRIFMPQQISPGNYKLRLTIEDLKARKYGQSTLDLQIKK